MWPLPVYHVRATPGYRHNVISSSPSGEDIVRQSRISFPVVHPHKISPHPLGKSYPYAIGKRYPALAGWAISSTRGPHHVRATAGFRLPPRGRYRPHRRCGYRPGQRPGFRFLRKFGSLFPIHWETLYPAPLVNDIQPLRAGRYPLRGRYLLLMEQTISSLREDFREQTTHGCWAKAHRPGAHTSAEPGRAARQRCRRASPGHSSAC